jgi:hypothetical protein
MRKRIFAVMTGVAATFIPFVGSAHHAHPAQAMTCAPGEIGYACRAVFGTVGAVCRGQVPKVPQGPIILASTAMSIDLCPPLG